MSKSYKNEFGFARASVILPSKIRSIDLSEIRPFMNPGTNSNGEILEFLNACTLKTWILEFTTALMYAQVKVNCLF